MTICQSCSTASTCDSCNNGLYLNSGQCTATCPSGTYQDNINNECITCSGNCSTCIGSASNCSSCPSNTVLYNGACTTSCPANYFNISGVC